jgi:hypothetical protein
MPTQCHSVAVALAVTLRRLQWLGGSWLFELRPLQKLPCHDSDGPWPGARAMARGPGPVCTPAVWPGRARAMARGPGPAVAGRLGTAATASECQ